MKQIVFTTALLALSCSAAYAASDATYSGTTLRIPHILYKGFMWDVPMTFKAPNKLVLGQPIPLKTMPNAPVVKVPDDLNFKLIEIAVGNEVYRANIVPVVAGIAPGPGTEFKFSGLAHPNWGIMLPGEAISYIGILEDDGWSAAFAISNNGKTIGGRSGITVGDINYTVPVRYLFDSKTIETFDLFEDGRLSSGAETRAANNNGAIAGFDNIKTAEGAPPIMHAFYNKTGKKLIDIGTLGGKNSKAYGMNNQDIVVGWSASKADDTDHVAFSYNAATQKLAALQGPLLGGSRSFAADINDAGQVTGVATTAEGAALAFIYKDGVAKSIGSLDNSGYSEARSISEKGHVTGWSLTAKGVLNAYLYDGNTMTAIPPLVEGDSWGFGVNSSGVVVGEIPGENGDWRTAWVYKNGKTTRLYDLLPAADKANWKSLMRAMAISDDGVVAGVGYRWRNKENKDATWTSFRFKLPDSF